MLWRLKEIKCDIFCLVISEGWNIYKEDGEGRVQFVRQKIIDEIWWDKIEYIISFTEPIYNMLWFADTKNLNLHLVYDVGLHDWENKERYL